MEKKSKLFLIGIVLVLIVLAIFVLKISNFSISNGFIKSDTAKQDQKISEDFKKVSHMNNLYYNKDTYIVYWIGGSYKMNIIGDDYTTSYMAPYYSPNGYLYRYNEQNKVLEEIIPGGTTDGQ